MTYRLCLMALVLSLLFSHNVSAAKKSNGNFHDDVQTHNGKTLEMTISCDRLEFFPDKRLFQGNVRLTSKDYKISSEKATFFDADKKVLAEYKVEIEHDKFKAYGQFLEAFSNSQIARLTGNPRPSVVEKIIIPVDGGKVKQVYLRADMLEIHDGGGRILANGSAVLERRTIGDSTAKITVKARRMTFFTEDKRAEAYGNVMVDGPDMTASGDRGTFNGLPEDDQRVLLLDNAWLETVDAQKQKRKVTGRKIEYSFKSEQITVFEPISEIGE